MATHYTGRTIKVMNDHEIPQPIPGIDGLPGARDHMLRHDLQGRDICNQRVLQAMAKIPRERFVPAEYQAQAYEDRPLPIGMDQTISQPYIVALMSQALSIDRDCKVLEIGTGSGYQTAILAELAKEVYTIERLGPLSIKAQGILSELGYRNIHFHTGDGSLGWPEPMQFDRIMVTAAIQRVPEPLIEQLVLDGLLVAPVGPAAFQTLMLVRKTDKGLAEMPICPVRFVRLIGAHGFQD